MAKITTRAEYKWNGDQYKQVCSHDYDYDGPLLECKGGGGSSIDPGTMGLLADQSAKLNRTDTNGTYGSSNWTVDPKTGRYKQTVNLDPSQQKQLDSRNAVAEQMLGNSKKQFDDINTPFGYSNTVSGPARAGFDKSMTRFSPQFDQQNRSFDQQMSNNGIPLGSEAYNKAEHNLSQGQSDQVQQAAQGASGTQAGMDVNERQQRYSDIANMMGTQNTQTPTSGTQAAIDTTGNFNMLNSGITDLLNQSSARKSTGTSSVMGLMSLFL